MLLPNLHCESQAGCAVHQYLYLLAAKMNLRKDVSDANFTVGVNLGFPTFGSALFQ